MKYVKIVFIVTFATLGFLNLARPQDKPAGEVEIIGEFFGQPVPAQNYFFVKDVLLTFAKRVGPVPQSEEELEDYAWDNLLLSYEAFRNNINATPEEINAEIKDILKENNLRFDWRRDKDTYARWVKEKTNQTTAVFENQVRFMVEINKLRQQVINSLSVQVSEEEARRQFQDEHNALSVEVAGFLKEEDAQWLYERVKEDPRVWEEEKGKHPASFKLYTLAALNTLMNELGVYRDALYKILELQNQGVQSPLPITLGYGVFKVLNKKLAPEAEYAKLKSSYFEKVKERKINRGFEDWLGQVKQKAKIKIYRKGG